MTLLTMVTLHVCENMNKEDLNDLVVWEVEPSCLQEIKLNADRSLKKAAFGLLDPHIPNV